MGLQQLKAEAIKLSPQERLELVTAIVESLQNAPVPQGDCGCGASPKDSASRRHRSAAINRMRGLLTTDRPAPTDEEVAAMLEARLTEKYS